MDSSTILGLGAIGIYIGLGLKRAGLQATEVVGFGRDQSVLSFASRVGSVDRTTNDLPKALHGAQLVVLETPTADVEEMLKTIAPFLESDCTVTDTSVTKIKVIDWARAYLPKAVNFVPGRPLLSGPVTRVEDADAQLFEDSWYCIIPDEVVDDNAIRTVVGMVEMLGAKPVFMDAQEHDSYSAALLLLPIIMSSAFFRMTSGSNSWEDMARFVGPEFNELSKLASRDPRETAAEFAASSTDLIYWIDKLILELEVCRADIKQGDDGLLDRLIQIWEDRVRWENDFVESRMGSDIRTSSQSMAGMLIGGRLVDKYTSISNVKRSDAWKYPRHS